MTINAAENLSIYPNPTREERLVAIYNQTASATYAHRDQIDNATRELVHANVTGVAGIVRGICPDATKLEWEWCGDGDAPSTLNTPHVTCPHAEDAQDLEDFQLSHPQIAGLPTVYDLAATFEEHELSEHGTALGIVTTRDRARDAVFTLDLTDESP